MKPEQSRAARGWLGWTQAQLAEAARVGLSTVKDFESGKRVPIANNLDAMQRALQDGGAADLLAAMKAMGGKQIPIDGT